MVEGLPDGVASTYRMHRTLQELTRFVGTVSQSIPAVWHILPGPIQVGSRAVRGGRHAATSLENVGWIASHPRLDLCEDR